MHLEKWPEAARSWRDTALEEKWQRLLEMRDKVLKELETVREKKEIGNSLEAEVELTIFNSKDFGFFKNEPELLAFLFLVSGVRVRKAPQESSDPVQIKVFRSEGAKCARCWIYRKEVGKDTSHPELCGRCLEVVKGLE